MIFFTKFKSRLKITLLIMLCLNGVWAYAQVPEITKWDKALGGWGDDLLGSMVATADGGYILGGSTASTAGGDVTMGSRGRSSLWLVKIDAAGVKAWDRTFSSGQLDVLTSVIVTDDGGYLMGGTTSYFWGTPTGEMSEPLRGHDDFWVIKLDRNGNKVWDRTIGGSSEEDLAAMVQTRDGGFLIGGTSSSGVSGNKTATPKGLEDYWVVKLGPDGSRLWERTYGGSDRDNLTSLAKTPDGGYVLGGYSSSRISSDKTEDIRYDIQGNMDYWVVKIDESGKKLWDRTMGGTDWDQLTSIAVSPLGDVYLGGNSKSMKGYDKSDGNAGYKEGGYRMDYWVVKLTSQGEKVWDKTFGGNYEDLLSCIVLTPDGGMFLAGSSSSGASGAKTDLSRGGFDYWIIKLASDGDKEWDKAMGGSGADVLKGASVGQDGGLFLAGHSKSYGGGDKSSPSMGGEDFWVAKVNLSGKVLSSLVPVSKVWDRRFGGTESDVPYAMVNAEGGYLVGGSSSSPVSGDKTEYHGNYFTEDGDFWLLKIRDDGTKEWDKTYGSHSSDYLVSIVKAPDGGYLLGGSSNGGEDGMKTSPSKGTRVWDYWVVKIDAVGNKLWDRSFGSSGDDRLAAMVGTPDGGYLLGGTSGRGSGFDKSVASKEDDYWVVKIDANGNRQWDGTFGGSRQDNLTSLVPSPDGGYLLGGYSNSPADRDKTTGSEYSDFWVVKIDAGGNKAWDRTFGQNEYQNNNLNSVVVTTDGNFLLGGTIHRSNAPITTSFNDYWVIKLDQSGSVVWDRKYGGEWTDHQSSMIATSDGGFLIGGRSNSDGSHDKTEAAWIPPSDFYESGKSDFWVLKADAEGKRQWDKTLGSMDDDFLTSLLETPDGDFLVAGYTTGGVGGDKTQDRHGPERYRVFDFWLVKLHSDFVPKNPPQKPGAITASGTSCLNSRVTFSVNPVADALFYTWSIPNGWVILAGQGTNSITVEAGAQMGVVSVSAGNSNGNSLPSTLQFTTEAGVAAGNTITGEQEVCAGSAAAWLTGAAPSGGQYEYRWEQSMVGNGNFTPALGINNAKDYRLGFLQVTTWFRRLVITQNGCESYSNVVRVSVLARPAKPGIVREGNTLTSSVAGTSYQWTLDGGWIPATTQSISIEASGSYKVRVINERGCVSETSDPQQFMVQPTGIAEESSWEAFHLVPNPSSGKVSLGLEKPWTNADLTVRDAMGRVVHRISFKLLPPKQELDLNFLPAGAYSVQVRSGSNSLNRRLLIIRQ